MIIVNLLNEQNENNDNIKLVVKQDNTVTNSEAILNIK